VFRIVPGGRCPPSSLYTFPDAFSVRAWLGITTLQASPNLTDVHPSVSTQDSPMRFFDNSASRIRKTVSVTGFLVSKTRDLEPDELPTAPLRVVGCANIRRITGKCNPSWEKNLMLHADLAWSR